MAVVAWCYVCTYTNSTDFYGGWKDGNNSRGTFNYANSSESVGEWVGEGIMHGHGVFKFLLMGLK